MITRCYPTWAFYPTFFFIQSIIYPFLFIFLFVSLLDLVRPFLDLVRPHSVSVVFIFLFLIGSISKSTDIESNLCPSLFLPNPSSPSLSIPPELFEISLSCIYPKKLCYKRWEASQCSCKQWRPQLQQGLLLLFVVVGFTCKFRRIEGDANYSGPWAVEL